MIRVSVMYPNTGEKFDFDYYVNQHMALARRLLEPYGLEQTQVDRGIGSVGPGAEAPYVAVGHLIFNSPEKMQKGLEAHDPDLAADVPNFTTISPEFQISEIIG